MRLVLDISDNRSAFFIELIQSLDYIRILKKIQRDNDINMLNDLTDAFDDVKAHNLGHKQLKTAEELYNEL